MKIKFIALIAAVALLTLSFTFAQVSISETAEVTEASETKTLGSEPAGGFASIEITK